MDGLEIIRRCRALAACTDEPGHITRGFLTPAMHQAHVLLGGWMEEAGLEVRVDAAGNLRGVRGGPVGQAARAKRLIIGSHIDTVPHAGAFDGVLGVIVGIALAARTTVPIEVVAFSEEESGRFIGSRALIGDPVMDDSVRDTIAAFGLDPTRILGAQIRDDVRGYVEFHIEQGPVLESLNLPLGVVDAIVGQTRGEVRFWGAANHAGTTPMHLRKDAVAAAAEWIVEVERVARITPDMVATVGQIRVEPGAGNVVAGLAACSLDIRHAIDEIREAALHSILSRARDIGERRGLVVECEGQVEQGAVALASDAMAHAVAAAGYQLHRMMSGAGHDAMIMARKVPASMLFLRTPGGVSHHPDETVLPEDVDAALAVGARLLAQ
jgi:allantoate deiminase